MTRLLGAKGVGAGMAGGGAGAASGRAGDSGAERGDSDAGEYADPMDEPNGLGPERLLDG